MNLIDRILAQIGVPINLILEQLDAIAASQPDLADAVAQAKAKVSDEFVLEKLLIKAKTDAAMLVELIQTGSGPIDPDDNTGIQ